MRRIEMAVDIKKIIKQMTLEEKGYQPYCG